jgi:hypothetical protein
VAVPGERASAARQSNDSSAVKTSSGWQRNFVSHGRPYIGGTKRVSRMRKRANRYPRSPASRDSRREVRELKRLVAKQALEVDFFKGALQRIEAGHCGSSGSGELASTAASGT